MKPLSRDERKEIVRKELYLLEKEEYISSSLNKLIVEAHEKYYHDLSIEEQRIYQEKNVVKKQIKQPTKQTPTKQVVKEKKPVSPEQARERNITWLLNLGVVLLLISGLVVATSNWETMTNFMKAVSISFVAFVFFGMAAVSGKFLKIDKTAFAFTVLGSLFLPIFLLSVGWFELIGTYLSMHGEGRYLFGTLSSFILLPVYLWFAKKLVSRLFVWFSYITLTIGVGYLLAALHLKQDGFYLGIMLFNALLLFLYHRVKNRENVKLFTKELIYFAQINLVLSTLLMLTFYNGPVFFGFNLILTASVYLSVVYVTGKKEFHFVFSAMIVYGVYQIVEHSFLDTYSPILFALIGIGFLALPKVLDDQFPWEKIFNWTSAVISGFAFLYITLEGFFLRMGEPSLVLLLGYVVITGNFLYLTNTMQKKLFMYLTTIFISAALFETMLLIDSILHFRSSVLPIFFIGFTLFIVFGSVLRKTLFGTIQQSSRDVGLVYMLFMLVVAYSITSWWETGLILFLLAVSWYVSMKHDERAFYKNAAPWLVPILIGSSIASFAEEARLLLEFYEAELGVAMNYLTASIFLAVLLPRVGTLLKTTSFYVAQGFYTLAAISAFIFPINEIWVRPLMILFGIWMYYRLYKSTIIRQLSYLVSIMTLLTYFTVLTSMRMVFRALGYFENIQFISGAVVVLLVAIYLKNRDNHLFRAFAVLGHMFIPLSLVLTFALYEEHSIWSFLMALVIYVISTTMAFIKWTKTLFLYSAYTTLFLTISNALEFVQGLHVEYAYLATSILLVFAWFKMNTKYQSQTALYFVPFTILGLFSFLSLYPYDSLNFILTLSYAVGLILFLHKIRWDFLVVIPLLSILIGTLGHVFSYSLGSTKEVLMVASIGLAMLVAGKLLYKRLFIKYEKVPFHLIDGYAIVSILAFLSLYLLDRNGIWLKILPGVLIAVAFWLQRSRVSHTWAWIPAFAAGAYLLQPYYEFLGEITISYLLEREMYVLPLVALGIYLQICLKKRYSLFTSKLQWALLIIVSLLLVQDGLASSTIYDALILGSLSLVSLLVGVFLRIKSYFFVGSGVLLLNVFLQTRPYWGNLPWWAYLLIAGSILISVASYNEWQKQKHVKGEKTALASLKEKLIKKLKEWN